MSDSDLSRVEGYSDYINTFNAALAFLEDADQLIPPALLDELGDIGAVKTVNYYSKVLKRLMRDLYNGKITEDDFIDGHAGYVQRQIRRAFNEGMRMNGLDPRKDMTAELEALYQDWVAEEWQYIDRLAEQIANAKRNGLPIDEFIARADLWTNRYTDIVNRAALHTGKDELYMWQLGATEDHCTDCLANNGMTKRASVWLLQPPPQSRDLECGGWRCDCRMVRIEDRPKTPMLFAAAT